MRVLWNCRIVSACSESISLLYLEGFSIKKSFRIVRPQEDDSFYVGIGRERSDALLTISMGASNASLRQSRSTQTLQVRCWKHARSIKQL